jgi:hypothetical protein
MGDPLIISSWSKLRSSFLSCNQATLLQMGIGMCTPKLPVAINAVLVVIKFTTPPFFWCLVSEESTFVAPLPYIHLHCLCPW